jgi:hypothetical protein
MSAVTTVVEASWAYALASSSSVTLTTRLHDVDEDTRAQDSCGDKKRYFFANAYSTNRMSTPSTKSLWSASISASW